MVVRIAQNHPYAGSYSSWRSYRRMRRRVLLAPLPADAVWIPCPLCWGQRVVIEGSLAYRCPACLGVGQTLPFVPPEEMR